MSNIKVKDFDGAAKYLSATGAGTDGDPYIPAQAVTGTVTANLSATDNAVLDTIDAVLDAVNAKLVTGTVIGDVNLGATDNAVLDAIAASASVLDDWDESDRAKVNLVVGQAGITAGAGTVAANTPRVTHASDDPAVAHLATLVTSLGNMDNSVDGNYLNVNVNVAGTDVAAGAGTVSAQTMRITQASDSPTVTSLAIMDDWDESDRAKVNLVVGQAGITAGAGAVAANTPRVTHASDDPVTTALQLLDNMMDGNYGNVNMNVAGTDIATGAGTINAQTIRTVPASDGTQAVSGTVTANLSATDNAVLDALVATAGATDGAKVITDANGTIQQYLRGLVSLVADTTPTSTYDNGPGQTITRTLTTSADMTTAAAITAAPTAGQKIVATDILVSTAVAGTITVEMETSANDLAVVYLPANGTAQISLRGYLKGDAADKKLFGKHSAAGAISWTVVYFSEA